MKPNLYPLHDFGPRIRMSSVIKNPCSELGINPSVSASEHSVMSMGIDFMKEYLSEVNPHNIDIDQVISQFTNQHKDPYSYFEPNQQMKQIKLPLLPVYLYALASPTDFVYVYRKREA